MKKKRVKQENIKDCGVACLLYIIRYYGGNNTMENIRYLTKCDREGVTAYNLVEAAKELGFEALGIKCDFEYLINNNKLPCICHIVINNIYKHYVVIEKVDKKNEKIIIFDPYYGVKKYTYDDFLNVWSNIIINFSPLRKLDNLKLSILNNFYTGIIKKNIRHFIIIILISFISMLLVIVNTYYFKSMLDNREFIEKIYITFILIILSKCLLDFFRNKMIIYLDKVVDLSISTNVFNKLTSLPNYYFNSRQTGDIMNRISELEYAKEIISKIPIILFIDVALLLISSVILININKVLFFIFIFVVFLYFIVVILFHGKIKKYTRLNQENYSIMNSFVKESVDGIWTIKNLNLEDYINNKFKLQYNKLIKDKYEYEKIFNVQSILKDIIVLIGINSILFVGLKLVNNGTILLSDLILFNSLILYFLEPLKNIFDLEPLIKNGINAINRTSDIFHIEEKNKGKYYSNDVFKIKFNNLNFSYGNNVVIENLCLDINKGDKVVIYGPSGSGKSTLFKILTKQYEVKENQTLVNNIDINDWQTKKLRKNIGYVSQDEQLFNDTILNNILLGNIVSNKKLKKVCKLTYVKEILKKKNINLNFLIEENGTNLSNGEKQRIILSRYLIRDNNVLILDESINGLNLNLERKILVNLLNIYKNKTLIYITHRVDNIDLFERKINFKLKT